MILHGVYITRRNVYQYLLKRIRSKHTIAVAMSGGIDSSAAAMILKDQGYDCVGVYMKNWDQSDEVGKYICSFTEDKRDMEDVCKVLNIPTVQVRPKQIAPTLSFLIFLIF
jgi:predicted PP-loop superfamily ATPase